MPLCALKPTMCYLNLQCLQGFKSSTVYTIELLSSTLISINAFVVMNSNTYMCTMINLVPFAIKVSKDCLAACC